MAPYKRCRERGCKAKDCQHEWFVYVTHRGQSARGPASKFRHVLKSGQRLPDPTSLKEATYFESLVEGWLRDGRPLPVAAPTPARDELLIATACEAYLKAHVEPALKGNGEAGMVERIKREVGALPLAMLLDRPTVRDFLAEIADEAPTSVNRHYSRWSHLVNWCRVEYQLTGPSPFY